MQENQLLTIAEVATELDMDFTDVKMLIETHRLETVSEGKVVRIPRKSLDEYIAERDGETPEKHASENVSTLSQATQVPKIEALTVKHEETITPARQGGQKTVLATKEDTPVTETVKDKRQKLAELKQLVELETEEISLNIKLAEAQKLRDLPDFLRLKKIDLEKREAVLKVREQEIVDKQVKIEADTKAQEQFCIETDTYCKGRRDECDKYYTDKVAEADQYFNSKKHEVELLDIDVSNRRDEITRLDKRIAEAQKECQNIIDRADSYLHKVKQHTISHYNQARKASGKTVEYHDNHANKGWDLQDEIKGLVGRLEKLLKV